MPTFGKKPIEQIFIIVSGQLIYPICHSALPANLFSGNKADTLGGSPGLVVMGEGSCSKGRGFDYWRLSLDGHDIFSR